MLEYGSKSIVSVVTRPRAPVAGTRVRLWQHAAQADYQTAAQGKLVGGLIGIDAAAVIVVIIERSPCCSNRREELGFQLNSHPWGNIDICPKLESGRKIAIRLKSGRRRHNVRSEQQAEEGPDSRIGDIPGKYRASHDKILAQISSIDLGAPIIAVIINTRRRRDMIIKNFDPDIAVDVKIDRATEIQPPGYAAVGIVKVISFRKSVADLGNQFHRGLSKGAASRQENKNDR